MSGFPSITKAVRAKLPDSQARYTDAELADMVINVDKIVREYCGGRHSHVDIQMLDSVMFYRLPELAIQVVGASVSTDGGSTFNVIELVPTSLSSMSSYSDRWRTTRSNHPERYCVLSAPGCPQGQHGFGGTGYSMIMLWPSVSGDAQPIVRVRYRSAQSPITVISQSIDWWTIENVYVPGVMAQIYCYESMDRFRSNWELFLVGMDELRAGLTAPTVEPFAKLGENGTAFRE